MFGGKNKQKIDEIDTVIGPGTNFSGNIEAVGIVRVDGKFSGDIATKGDIIVGENGFAQGNLRARNMIIAGSTEAALNCAGKLHIKTNGKVYGDVEVDSILIDEKAIFQGKCLMRKEEKNMKKESVSGENRA